MQDTASFGRLTQLDGVRALLALWVLFGHVSLFLGCNYPLLNNPAIAVDLFMVLSGLFIANTFDALRQRHDHTQAARYFWIRRVLRIWPLYATILTLCWLFIGHCDQWMQATNAAFPRAGADAFLAPRYRLPTWDDALLHYSMLFGVVASSATSTPLPDWSLSLEFQFYLLFPWLYLLLRGRLLWVCGFAVVAAYVSPALLGFYVEPGLWAHFDQPSVLTYKLNLFLVGVFMNTLLKAGPTQDRRTLALLAVAMVACLAVAGFLTTLGIAVILFLVLRPESWLARTLSLPIPRFFGDISFTIYLVHRPLLLAITGTLATHAGFVALPGAARFVLVGAAVFMLTTLVSWGFCIAIEQPANRFGHRLTTAGKQYVSLTQQLSWLSMSTPSKAKNNSDP